MRNHPELFRSGNVENDRDLSALRWTVDEKEDVEFMRAVYRSLPADNTAMDDVLCLLKRHPELRDLNAHYKRGEGLVRSLREDRLV
jgi:spore coat polysaccharide biosynthesis protein SpsF (cytidylyltransferase family)